MLNFLCSLLLQTHNRCRHETKCNVLDWVCSCVSLKFMTLSHPRWLLGWPFWNWFLKLWNWCPELEFRSYSWAYRLKKWTFLWTTIGKIVKEKKKKKKRKKEFPSSGIEPAPSAQQSRTIPLGYLPIQVWCQMYSITMTIFLL